jgi:hypothetical protein
MSILESLDKQAATMLQTIPSGKSASATVGITVNGVEFQVAQRWKNVTVIGSASREWKGSWSAGAKLNVVW